ncbi:hypothetical protein LX64_00690 [Chitinophaga skermanii]|uniref:Uncharacterized protein n=1 Tax=Chitinophaga skermanii TaxID=331697 RepID=A0A327R547_9BACT|nr:ATP-binding protein [Chitinophaga skermanii]RAJ11082.1 hypothetical protein LX64_00690 [Chitinophaga skermanii]
MIFETVTLFFAGLMGDLAVDFTKDQLKEPLQRNFKLLREAYKDRELPVNHDIQKAVRKSLLFAGAEAAQWWRANFPPSAETDVNAYWKQEAVQRTIADFFENELHKFSDPHYIPLNTITDKPILLNFTKEKSQWLSQQHSDFISRLAAIIIDELENYLQQLPSKHTIPTTFNDILVNGWSDKKRKWSIFDVMCDYFHELIKTDERLRAIIQTEWLGDIKIKLEQLTVDLSAWGNKFIDTYGKSPQYFKDILTKLNPQPFLLLNFDTSSYAEITFRSRYVPLIGRTDELNTLHEFWDSPELFEWCMVTGAAGSGKSRLALEFCCELDHIQTIHAGFANIDQLASFQWYNWEPVCPCLIVIDYTAFVQDEVIKILKLLKERNEQDTLPFKVKFILLERSFSESWSDQFRRAIKLGDIPNFYGGEAIQLQELDMESIDEICSYVLKQKGQKFPQHYLSKLYSQDEDRRKRPLFAIILALAVADSNDVNDWDIDHVFEDLLDRYLQKIWLPAAIEDKEVLHKHLNLLAIATMTGGLNMEDLDKVLDQNHKWLPNDNFDKDLYRLASPSSNHEITCSPLEPDILGEYFVRWQLKRNGKYPRQEKDRERTSIEMAWVLKPIEYGRFVFRTFQDFSTSRNIDKHQTITSLQTLLELPIESSDGWWVRWFADILNAVVNIFTYVDHIYFEHFKSFFEDKIEELFYKYDFEEVDNAFATLLNVQIAHAAFTNMEEAEAHFERLAALYNKKDNLDIKSMYARALTSMGYGYILSKSYDNIKKCYAQLLSIEYVTPLMLKNRLNLISAMLEYHHGDAFSKEELYLEACSIYGAVHDNFAHNLFLQCKRSYIKHIQQRKDSLAHFSEMFQEGNVDYHDQIWVLKAEAFNAITNLLLEEDPLQAFQYYETFVNVLGIMTDYKRYVKVTIELVEVSSKICIYLLKNSDDGYQRYFDRMISWCKDNQNAKMVDRIGEGLVGLWKTVPHEEVKLMSSIEQFWNLDGTKNDDFRERILQVGINLIKYWIEISELKYILHYKNRLLEIAKPLPKHDYYYWKCRINLYEVSFYIGIDEEKVIQCHHLITGIMKEVSTNDINDMVLLSCHGMINHFADVNKWEQVERTFEELRSWHISSNTNAFIQRVSDIFKFIFYAIMDKNDMVLLKEWHERIIGLNEFIVSPKLQQDYIILLGGVVEKVVEKENTTNDIMMVFQWWKSLVDSNYLDGTFELQTQAIRAVLTKLLTNSEDAPAAEIIEYLIELRKKSDSVTLQVLQVKAGYLYFRLVSDLNKKRELFHAFENYVVLPFGRFADLGLGLFVTKTVYVLLDQWDLKDLNYKSNIESYFIHCFNRLSDLKGFENDSDYPGMLNLYNKLISSQ